MSNFRTRDFRQRLADKSISKFSIPQGEVSAVGTASAAGGKSDVGHGFANILQSNPDDLVLAAKGGGLELFEKVLQDDQVFSTFQQRRLALLAKKVEVEPGATDKQSIMAADFVRDMICGLEFDDICNKMMYGIFYGYGVGECLYARDGRHWLIEDVKVRKAKRFRYDKTGQLRLTKIGHPGGIVMPERKFWTFESGSDHHDNPYGIGLGSRCYWPTFFKRHGIRYWTLALEKYGAPTALGKYPANATQKEKDTLLDAVAAYASASGLAIPDGMSIELLTAGSKVGGNHDKLCDVMDAAISKVVLSQTMTTDNGSSNSQAQVHENVMDNITAADADLLSGSFMGGPLQWLMEWNYPAATAPVIGRQTEPPEDLDKQVERDYKLYQMGVLPTEQHIMDTYGDGYVLTQKAPEKPPEKASEALPAGDPAEFSQGGSFSAVDNFLGGQDHYVALEDETEAMIAEFEQALMSAETLEDGKAALLQLMAVPETDAFATRLAQAGFNARLHGRAVIEPEERA